MYMKNKTYSEVHQIDHALLSGLARKIQIMKVLLLLFLSSLVATSYGQSLLPSILLVNDTLKNGSKDVILGPKSFYVDGNIKSPEDHQSKYVFNNMQDALARVIPGTEDDPMVIYIAPWVYWIDHPDDPDIRKPSKPGVPPYGMEVNCPWLKLIGLSDDSSHTVLASNRGQTIGANGNFTMFSFTGDGLTVENLTFGNYCNVDLDYPLNPLLSRKKRADAIVQAQLAFCKGDKILARNCRFISRLNLCPIIGGDRTLYDRCHFESTDDALNGNAVYLGCTFNFYSGKPFYITRGCGAVLLDCDIRAITRGEQYFVKSGGPLSVIDSRITSETISSVGWQAGAPEGTVRYTYNFTWNGMPVDIESQTSNTVRLEGKSVLDAYRFEFEDKVHYNIYNLLKGKDDWDPMGIKELVKSAEKHLGRQLTEIPIKLELQSPTAVMETGKDSLFITAEQSGYGWDLVTTQDIIAWQEIASKDDGVLKLLNQSPSKVLVKPHNQGLQEKEALLVARHANGLEAVAKLKVLPHIQAPPEFSEPPVLSNVGSDDWVVEYAFAEIEKDISVITWFRCSDGKGRECIPVEVTRFDHPLKNYTTSELDNGYFLKAVMAPKLINTLEGERVELITANRIHSRQTVKEIDIDFSKISVSNQPKSIPGFFSWDAYAPQETKGQNWLVRGDTDAWFVGKGRDGGAADTGLIQSVQGARLWYTPASNQIGNMSLELKIVPFKTAGQGFGSARNQYLEIYIQYEGINQNGYALRIERTPKYSDAVDFTLMKIERGISTPISASVSTTCFRPDCLIQLSMEGSRLSARAFNDKSIDIPKNSVNLSSEVQLSAEVNSIIGYGFGLQHTGTVGANACLIKNMKVSWK